jgi:plasmid stabilization system protein ParE
LPPPDVTRTLEIHPAAEAEAEAAVRFYSLRNPRAAIAFAEELDAAIARISTEPHIFVTHDFGTRRLLLRTFPFSVIFRVEDSTVLVVAVAHGNRRPGYWAGRVPA